MRLVDRALPAVEHLVGERALDVLRPPVTAAGGILESVRPVHVQYRPGSDVIVRYSALISWEGQPAKRDTLAAASTVWGPLPGTVTVTADTPTGPLEVGVWRWPFDPVLAGLAAAVDTEAVASLLGLDGREVQLDVVAYRPTERAVIAVSTPQGVHCYLKVVAPEAVDTIAARHVALTSAGVPAPDVMICHSATGVLALKPLRGPTWRELIKAEATMWVDLDEFDRLADAFAEVRLDAPALPSRLGDAALHARMLSTVLPRLRDRIEPLIERFEHAVAPVADTTVHGDLHEAQLVVRDGRIVGVLDIDDAGPGSAIDDRANVLARLLFRSTLDHSGRTDLAEYAHALRTASLRRFDAKQLDLHTSAALVGLATGPFRMQGTDWRSEVTALIERASMRDFSAAAHNSLTGGCA